MFPIHIDLSEVVDEFALTGSQSKELGMTIIDRIVAEYTHRWENLVNKNLGATRDLYKNAMFVERVSDTEVVFGLKSEGNDLALAIEEGRAPYDLKEGFANSSKKKTSIGGGWYVTVPFRYATSNAVAQSMLFQGVLPRSIYDIARKNAGASIRTEQLPKKYQQVGQRSAINRAGVNIPAYTHKSPAFQGLVRLNVASTPGKNRSGYFTFRRVSDKSDPQSWIHPGFEPRKFMDKALDASQIPQIADIAIDQFLAQLP